MFIIGLSIFIVKFRASARWLKNSAVRKGQGLRDRRKEGKFLFRLFVGVFLKIRDHGHDFLLAQVKPQKEGRGCDKDREDRLQNVSHIKYLLIIYRNLEKKSTRKCRERGESRHSWDFLI